MVVVKRIVTDIATDNVADVRDFYALLFDLRIAMDMGWIATLTGDETGPAQLSVMREGGSGAPVPDISIEVDDVDAVHARAQAMGLPIAYALTDEPWGVRRFFVRDPAGKLLNVLAH
ncbi:MAG: VOC family protein [Pseudomonadota bacterium]